MLLRILLKASTKLDWEREMTAPLLLTMEAGLLPVEAPDEREATVEVRTLPFTVFWETERTFMPTDDVDGDEEEDTEGRVVALVMLTAVADSLEERRVAAILF